MSDLHRNRGTRQDATPRELSAAELEAADLAFGARALRILLWFNAFLLLLLALSLLPPLASLVETAGWVVLLELLVFVVVFLPVFLWRMLARKDGPKLAAARAVQSFFDGFGMAG